MIPLEPGRWKQRGGATEKPITIERPSDKDCADERAKYVEPYVFTKVVGGKADQRAKSSRE